MGRVIWVYTVSIKKVEILDRVSWSESVTIPRIKRADTSKGDHSKMLDSLPKESEGYCNPFITSVPFKVH